MVLKTRYPTLASSLEQSFRISSSISGVKHGVQLVQPCGVLKSPTSLPSHRPSTLHLLYVYSANTQVVWFQLAAIIFANGRKFPKFATNEETLRLVWVLACRGNSPLGSKTCISEQDQHVNVFSEHFVLRYFQLNCIIWCVLGFKGIFEKKIYLHLIQVIQQASKSLPQLHYKNLS